METTPQTESVPGWLKELQTPDAQSVALVSRLLLRDRVDSLINEHQANRGKPKTSKDTVEGECREIPEKKADIKPAPESNLRPGFTQVEANCPICDTEVTNLGEDAVTCPG